MYEESQVYAKAVFLKAHFFGQKFRVLKVDKMLVDYYTKQLELSCPVPLHRHDIAEYPSNTQPHGQFHHRPYHNGASGAVCQGKEPTQRVEFISYIVNFIQDAS